MARCPRTMTQHQWTIYRERIIREAHLQQAAAIRGAFASTFAVIARLARRHLERRPSEAGAPTP